MKLLFKLWWKMKGKMKEAGLVPVREYQHGKGWINPYYHKEKPEKQPSETRIRFQKKKTVWQNKAEKHKKQIKYKWWRVKTKFEKFIQSDLFKEQSRDWSRFIVFILAYGFFINYAVWAIVDWLWIDLPFTIYTIPAFGIAYYFIKEELPLTIKRMKK